MLTTVKKIRFEQRRRPRRRDRPICDPPAGVATSTIGSSENIPREPLRTIRTVARARAASRGGSRRPPRQRRARRRSNRAERIR